MFEDYTDYIKKESKREYPLEAVFLITKKSGCYKVNNIATNPTDTFAVCTKDITNAVTEGLLAVVHSHPDGLLRPSGADMQTQINYGIPFGIITTDGELCSDLLWWGDGVPTPDLYNRTFVHGVTDCYAFVRDYYKTNLNISLPDYARDWDWWTTPDNLLLNNLMDAGFTQVDMEAPKKHDMFLSMISTHSPNHAGVYIGDGLIAHHRTSGKAIDPTRPPETRIFQQHKPCIYGVYRHKDLF